MRSSFRGDSYFQASGTSQAAPFVAGVAALFAEADATARGARLGRLLRQFAAPHGILHLVERARRAGPPHGRLPPLHARPRLGQAAAAGAPLRPVNAFHVNGPDRVLTFHRWVPGAGRDVVVVISLREQTFYDQSYRLGFPVPGRWLEVFNGDAYDNFPNPSAQGNAGGVDADGPPLRGLPHSAGVTIPADGVLVFARDTGD